MLQGIEYRIYPNKEQQALLAKHFGCNRLIYNKFLDMRTAYFLKHGTGISKYELNNYVTFLKKTDEFSFLREVHSQTLQQSVQDLDTAFINYFRNPEKKDLKKRVKKKLSNDPDYIIKLEDHKGYPAYKSKHSHRYSIRFPQGGKISDGMVFIPKLKWIPARIHRTIEGEIHSVTIKQVPSGKYFAVFLIEDGIPKPPIQKPIFEKAIGIDLGIKDFCILSDGTKIANPKFLRNKEKRLKILQKRLSRKQKGSQNRNKARIKVAKYHEKIKNERNDFLQKLSTKLINDNQVNTCCIEDLAVQNMMQNHKLAKSIAEVSWYRFRYMLEYKARRVGKNILVINRFAPSSRLCPCGYKNKDLTLADREWTCPICGTHHDRDILAANNIKKMAFAKIDLESFSRSERPVEPAELLSIDRALKQEAFCFS